MILLPITVTTELYIVWICLVGDSGIHLHLPLLLGGFASQGTMSVWEQKKWKNKKKSIWYPKKHADLSSKKQLTKERTNRTQVVVYQKVMNHAGSSILRKSVKTKFTHAQHVTPKNHPPTPPPHIFAYETWSYNDTRCRWIWKRIWNPAFCQSQQG